MKEAAGEANMTVITIVLIAIVLVVGGLIVRGVLSNTGESAACNSAGGTWQDGACHAANDCDHEGNCAGNTLTCAQDNDGNWRCE